MERRYLSAGTTWKTSWTFRIWGKIAFKRWKLVNPPLAGEEDTPPNRQPLSSGICSHPYWAGDGKSRVAGFGWSSQALRGCVYCSATRHGTGDSRRSLSGPPCPRQSSPQRRDRWGDTHDWDIAKRMCPNRPPHGCSRPDSTGTFRARACTWGNGRHWVILGAIHDGDLDKIHKIRGIFEDCMTVSKFGLPMKVILNGRYCWAILQGNPDWDFIADLAQCLEVLACSEASSERTNRLLKRILSPALLRMGHDVLLSRIVIAKPVCPARTDEEFREHSRWKKEWGLTRLQSRPIAAMKKSIIFRCVEIKFSEGAFVWLFVGHKLIERNLIGQIGAICADDKLRVNHRFRQTILVSTEIVRRLSLFSWSHHRGLWPSIDEILEEEADPTEPTMSASSLRVSQRRSNGCIKDLFEAELRRFSKSRNKTGSVKKWTATSWAFSWTQFSESSRRNPRRISRPNWSAPRRKRWKTTFIRSFCLSGTNVCTGIAFQDNATVDIRSKPGSMSRTSTMASKSDSVSGNNTESFLAGPFWCHRAVCQTANVRMRNVIWNDDRA